jgi:hypothetical protein
VLKNSLDALFRPRSGTKTPALGRFEPDLWSLSAQSRLFQHASEFSELLLFRVIGSPHSPGPTPPSPAALCQNPHLSDRLSTHSAIKLKCASLYKGRRTPTPRRSFAVCAGPGCSSYGPSLALSVEVVRKPKKPLAEEMAEVWAKEGKEVDWQRLMPPRGFQVLPRR